MTLSLALKLFFFEGLKLMFANQVSSTHVIHNGLWKDMGHMWIYNFCLFTFAISLISIRTGGTGGTGWGKGDVTQEPSPRNTDTNSLLQFIMFCPIIFGPSTIPAIHMCTIHKSYTYTGNFCFSPYYIEYSKFLAFLCGNFYKEASQDLTTQPFRLRGFFSLGHPM